MLHLSSNLLQIIPAFAFRGLHNLKILILQKNQIHTIEHNGFAGLHSLEILTLQQNHIKKINTFTFAEINGNGSKKGNSIKYLSSLIQISLTQNKIYSIEQNAFQGLKNLKIIV